MALKQRLDQKQVQKLILAPALQQAIKLLPLTNLELVEVIDTELSQNPMLEQAENTDEESPEEEEKTEESGQDKSLGSEEDDGSSGEMEDEDFNHYFQEYFDNEFRPRFSEKKESLPLENFISKSPSLWDHLNWQANLSFFEAEDKKVAQYIIGNITQDGYLISSEEDIASAMNVSVEKVREIRDKIKRFDPVGVGSLSLKEALLTQMEYYEIKDPIAREIVTRYLPMLEKSSYLKLAKKLGVALDAIKSRIDVIKELDPAPGQKYAHEKTNYVVPDILVRKENSEYEIILNDEGLPHLRINNYYKSLLSKASKENPEAYRYMKDKMKKAFWFLRSLDQRNQTIYKVAKYIVEKQKDFIEKGIEWIKPLTLIDLAQEIGVHESTVGRVVANKYMMTPRGVFPLNYFFHKSLSGDFGEEVSSLRVKERIKKLVEKEDKEKPLSDIEIGKILSEKNFNIARRTVAKYRKQLRIPPSHIRKRKYWVEED
ncbi:RNA polymerase factor sigma-54 [bacterium]|nr:RNA polymerase factor sigma-54 [bacterium]